MTTVQKQIKPKSGKKRKNKAATNYGVDLSTLSDNLKKSVAERIRRHQIALNTVQKLRKAKFL
jgi:hypothetical protein